MLLVYLIIWFDLIFSWHHFVVFLYHTKQNHKLFGNLVKLISVFFIFVTHSSYTLLVKEFLLKLVDLLLIDDMVFISPKLVDKLLHKLFKEYLLLILLILSPIRRRWSVRHLFQSIQNRRLLRLVYHMRVFTPKSDLIRVTRVKGSVLGPESDPS